MSGSESSPTPLRRPVIAVTCQRRDPGAVFKLEPSLVIISDYLDAVWRAGGLPVPVFPPGIDSDTTAAELARDVLAQADGVIAIGGLDVDPARYGEEPHSATMAAPSDQEQFEAALITAALEAGTPLLAICRGMQLLNVVLGGTMYQHITGADGFDAHGIPNGGGGTTNDYRFDADSLVAEVMGGETASGRCHHHQAVAEVADGLIVTGRTADGNVEVLELAEPNSWMLAVQWHPEETAATDPQNQGLFDGLVRAART